LPELPVVLPLHVALFESRPATVQTPNAGCASRRDYRPIFRNAQATRAMVATKVVKKPTLSMAGHAAAPLKLLFVTSSGAMDSAWQICNNVFVSTLKRRSRMALSAHLQELSEKHRQLERRIEEETSRPGSD